MANEIRAAQRVRTSLHREQNKALGISTLTVPVPDKDKERFALAAEQARAYHIMYLFEYGTDDDVAILSRKRSPWTYSHDETMQSINRLQDSPEREELIECAAQFFDVSTEIEDTLPYIFGTVKEQVLKAKKVAFGYMLAYRYKELIQ